MADVKFSELSALNAADVASDDILAIVDTTASTSKKLTIENLFARVPVSIAVDDATDSTSATTGSIQTDGGIGLAKKLWVGTTLSVGTTSTLTGAVTATAGVFPAAGDGATLGSAALEWGDLYLATAGRVYFQNDQSAYLQGDAAGILMGSTKKLGFAQTDFAESIWSSADGQLDVVAGTEVQIVAPTIDINASTAVLVSNDLKLDNDAAVLGFGENNDVTLTHVHDTGLLLNSTRRLQFNDATQYISGTSATVLSIAGDAEIDLTATAIDINGLVDMSGLVTVQTGIVPNASDGAYLGTSALEFSDLFLADGAVIALGDGGADVTLTHVADAGVQVNDTNKFMFYDTGLFVHATADSALLVSSDGTLGLTATTSATVTSPILKVGTASADGAIQALTNAYDTVFKQYDGDAVARIHDGATVATLETTALDLTLAGANKGGFGFKRPVYNVTPGADDADCLLTLAHSGSIIMVTGADYDLDIILPVIAAGDEGFWVTVIISTVFGSGKNMEVATNGHGDTTDTIHLYGIAGTASGSDVAGGDVVRTQDVAVVGTKLEFTCLKGGTNEQWICEYVVPSGSAPTVEAAVA